MNYLRATVIATLMGCLWSPFCMGAEDNWRAAGTNGVVVAGSAEAVEAGLEIMQLGGNAVDAAVASLLVLSVTDPGNFCFGGEVPIIVYNAERKSVEVLAGQGAAPR